MLSDVVRQSNKAVGSSEHISYMCTAIFAFRLYDFPMCKLQNACYQQPKIAGVNLGTLNNAVYYLIDI